MGRFSLSQDSPTLKSVSGESAAAGGFSAARDFGECPRVGREGFRDSLAVDELTLAAAGNQAGFAENPEMVRDSGGGDAAQGDDVPTAHAPVSGDGLEDAEAGLVGQGFGYFFNLGTDHGPI